MIELIELHPIRRQQLRAVKSCYEAQFLQEQMEVMLKKESPIYLISCRGNGTPAVCVDNRLDRMHLMLDSDESRDDSDLHFSEGAVSRKRMCEWCYRIIDLIGASREIVVVAFNYLDRFLARNIFAW